MASQDVQGSAEYHCSFEGPSEGWPVYDAPNVTTRYISDEYVVSLQGPIQATFWAPVHPLSEEQWQVEIPFRVVSGQGVVVGAAWGRESDYRGAITTTDGKAALLHQRNGVWQTPDPLTWQPFEWTASEPPHTLKLKYVDGVLSLWLGSRLVYHICVDRVVPQRIGMVIGTTSDRPCTVAVDSFGFLSSADPEAAYGTLWAAEDASPLHVLLPSPDRKSDWGETSSWSWSGDAYVGTVTNERRIGLKYAPMPTDAMDEFPSDFRFQVVLEHLSDGYGAAGVIWGADLENYYCFFLDNDGNFALRMQQDDTWVDPPIPWTRACVAGRDGDASTLEARVRGDRVTLYVNGVIVGQAETPNFGPGFIALAVSTRDAVPVSYAFSRLFYMSRP